MSCKSQANYSFSWKTLHLWDGVYQISEKKHLEVNPQKKYYTKLFPIFVFLKWFFLNFSINTKQIWIPNLVLFPFFIYLFLYLECSNSEFSIFCRSRFSWTSLCDTRIWCEQKHFSKSQATKKRNRETLTFI